MAGAGEKGGDRYGAFTYIPSLTRCDDDMRDLRAIRIRLRGCAFTFIYYGSILDINKMEGFCARGSILTREGEVVTPSSSCFFFITPLARPLSNDTVHRSPVVRG
jgi:hypothetical protein